MFEITHYDRLSVAKFGGTSVASVDAMFACAHIITSDPSIKLVVVSAQSGMTDLLTELTLSDDLQQAHAAVFRITQRQTDFINGCSLEFLKPKLNSIIDRWLEQFQTLVNNSDFPVSDTLRHRLLAQGEYLSSELIGEVLTHSQIKNCVVDASQLIKVHKLGEVGVKPNLNRISFACRAYLSKLSHDSITVTQGFIGSDVNTQEFLTLGRGGSDFSAALLAEAVKADELQLWTDVEGIFTADPRVVKSAQLLESVSFNQANRMARFGAKVVHPDTIAPVMRNNIPVLIAATKYPNGNRTWVKQYDTQDKTDNRALSITRRKSQALITVEVGSVAERIDPDSILKKLSNTQLYSDWLTYTDNVLNVIVNQPVLNNANAVVAEIEHELADLGAVNVETDLSLISIIGDGFCNNHLLIQKLLAYLADYPVRNLMIGTSDHLINWLIPAEFEETMIIDVHRLLFEDKMLNNAAADYDLSVAS